jgi:aldehyde:ferredoxin oxidoreductase
METHTAQSAVKTEITAKNLRVAVIGPAGEELIPFSVILTDHGRVAGRTGMGAVMGSKNLKAIAVKGTGKVPVANNNRYAALRSTANQELRADGYSEVFRDLGSAGAADYFDYLAEMPKKYFQHGIFKGAAKITGSSIAKVY